MKDLTTIPTKYHILFECDWNTGNESTMTSMERSKFVDLYLQSNKWEVSAKIKLGLPASPEDPTRGFVEDDDEENKHQGFVF